MTEIQVIIQYLKNIQDLLLMIFLMIGGGAFYVIGTIVFRFFDSLIPNFSR